MVILFSTATPPPMPPTVGDVSPNTGRTVGIAVGVVTLLIIILLIIILAVLIFRRRRYHRKYNFDIVYGKSSYMPQIHTSTNWQNTLIYLSLIPKLSPHSHTYILS